MSGKIRSQLGRNRGHALKQLQIYKDLINNNHYPWSENIKPEFLIQKNRLTDFLEKFKEDFNKWDVVCSNISNKAEAEKEEKLYLEWMENPEYDDLIYELENIVEELQVKLKVKVSETATVSATNTGRQNPISCNQTSLTTVPQFNLPKFDGDYLKWNQFWQRFEHAIHLRPYPKIEKLISLLGFLEGRALEEVEGFAVSEENYDTIVETLVDRFGKKPLIIKQLQAKLRGIDTAKSNPESLRTTVNMICNLCRQLQNLGVDIENYSMKLDIIDKLPHHEKEELNWLLISDSENATIEKLMKRMKEMALRAELAPKIHDDMESEDHYEEKITKSDSDSSFSTTSKNSQKNIFSCSFCNGHHKSSSCPTFVSVEDKLKQLKAKNCCIKCTNPHHTTRRCISKVKCKLCDGHHYTFLCNTKNTSSYVTVDKKHSTLLSTQITITNPENNITTEAVVIFDSGSQQSYITNNIIDQLKLSKIQEEKITVSGFGAKASTYNSSVVKFQIKTKNGYKEVFANSIKKIVSATVIDAIVDPRQEKFKQCPQDSSMLHTKCLPSINMIKNLLSVKQGVTATDTSKYKQEYPVVEIEQQIQIPSVQKISSGTKVFVYQSDKIIQDKNFKRQLRVCFSSQQQYCKSNEFQTPSTFWSREWLVKHSKKFPQLWLEKICNNLKEKLVHSATDELKKEFVIQPKLGCIKILKDKPPEFLLNKIPKKDEQQIFVHIHATEERKIDLESVIDPDHSISCRRECREETSRICIIIR